MNDYGIFQRCELCDTMDVDERAWQEQDGRTLCPRCVDLYTDEELNDRLYDKRLNDKVCD